jgi:site-specific DNA-methyltransferase (adenine-specific)
MNWPEDYVNTIVEGDCVEVMRSMPDETVDLIVTSPPYNCRKDYGTVTDEVPWSQYYELMEKVVKEMYRVLVVGGTIAINVPLVVRWQRDHKYSHTWFGYDPQYPTHKGPIRTKGKARIEPLGIRIFQMMANIDSHVREPIVWVKASEGQPIATTFQMGCDSDPYMRPTHEYVLLGSKGQWYHRGGTGRRGKEAVPFLDCTKDVWWIPATSHPDHPATFPIELPRRLIKLFVHAPDAVVLDPFAGTGTTCLAAKEERLAYIGIEADPEFARIARYELSQEYLPL